jgi:hypothetical protein
MLVSGWPNPDKFSRWRRAIGMVIGIDALTTVSKDCRGKFEPSWQKAIVSALADGTARSQSTGGHGFDGTVIVMRLMSAFMALPLTISMANIV